MCSKPPPETVARSGTPDPYEQLQVAPGADPAVIDAAYRVLAAGAAGDEIRLARLAEAHAALMDVDRRAAHDRARATASASEEDTPIPAAWPLGLAFALGLAGLVATTIHFRAMVGGAIAAGPAPGAPPMFTQKCAGCHGANGGGGLGPSLAGVEAKGDAFIRERILDGSPTKGMPAFREILPTRDVDALVRYVKGL